MIRVKKIEIFKPNEIIRGNPLNLSLEGKKMMNAIIYAVSKYHLNNRNMRFKMRFFKMTMNLEKTHRYVDLITDALKSLAAPIVLKNYTDDKGVFYRAKSLAFIDNDFSIEKGENTDEHRIYFKINKVIFKILKEANKCNFTVLEWKRISNKLNSKHAVSLYEYLKSFENQSKYLRINLTMLNEIFGFQNLELSRICTIIDRCMAEIKSKSDFKFLEYEKNKAEKEVIFYLSPKAKIRKLAQINQANRQIKRVSKAV